jgi:hypothetical protein
MGWGWFVSLCLGAHFEVLDGASARVVPYIDWEDMVVVPIALPVVSALATIVETSAEETTLRAEPAVRVETGEVIGFVRRNRLRETVRSNPPPLFSRECDHKIFIALMIVFGAGILAMLGFSVWATTGHHW